MKAKDILIPAGLIIAWFVFAQRKALNLLSFLITKIKLSFEGITPILNVNLVIQNPSNEKYTINSFVGNLQSGTEIIGNVSSFVPTVILPNSQTTYPLTIRLSLIGVVSDLIALIQQGSGISQTLILNGYLNASGIVAPVNISYKIG